jgi:hypothetical protein
MEVSPVLNHEFSVNIARILMGW